VPIPDVLGMSGPAAREYLRSLHLEYREVGRRASEDMASGAVLAQDPPPNLQVRQGAVVKVVLSEGPSHVVVPNVTQMSAAQAERNLHAAGLAVGRVQEDYSEAVPPGYVASTLPQTGARVVRGTAVDLIVSRGPPGTLPPAVAPPPGEGAEGGRTELLTFIVPAEGNRDLEVTVTVEVLDKHGKRKMYEGKHTPGEAIPPQRITVTDTTTARIFVNGRLRAEREYLP
jgi:beta-lactam-binding protein with PASTA domain